MSLPPLILPMQARLWEGGRHGAQRFLAPPDARPLSGKANPGGKQGPELLPRRERPPGLRTGQEIAKGDSIWKKC